MIEIYDRSRTRAAVAENAYTVSETRRLNSIDNLSFSLPWDDRKNQFCQPLHYVRHNKGALYRIMPNALTADEAGGYAYECEHVLATLIDNVMTDYHVIGGVGIYTDDVIRYILGFQHVQNWVLDECDFHYQFEYGWENETLLHALFSVAAPIAEPYVWRTDTSVYPWRLSLKRLAVTGNPDIYLRYGHNVTKLGQTRDPQQICTRIYPLGYGEGVNQLDIREVNGGVPYLQSPPEIVAKYGIVERVMVDRQYTNPESLKAAGAALLRELQEPAVSYEVGFTGTAEAGQRVRIYYPNEKFVDTYITEVTHNFDDVEQSTIQIANRTNIAADIADLDGRQRIEQTYAQGATQVYAQALQANCDSGTGAIMDFFIPKEMRIVNKVLAKIRIDQFRAYSKTTNEVSGKNYTDEIQWNTSDLDKYGNVSVKTSQAGEASGKLNMQYALGDYWKGGFFLQDTARGKASSGNKPDKYEEQTEFNPDYHSHTHTLTSKNHRHSGADLPSHHHTFVIPGHWHTLTIPGHKHDIAPGIYRFGNPQSFRLLIDGIQKAVYATRDAELDITNYLVGSDGKIPRDKWMALEVLPDSLSYASIVLVVQGFIQSRGGYHA